MAGAMTMITEETVVELENGTQLDTNKCSKDIVLMGSFQAVLAKLVWECCVKTVEQLYKLTHFFIKFLKPIATV